MVNVSKRVLDIKFDGMDEVIKEISTLHEAKIRRRELRKIMGQPAQKLVKQVQKTAPKYMGKDTRFKVTRYGGLESRMKLHAGTLKRSIKKFNAKKSASVYVGPKVLKRPKSLKGFYRNVANWDKNGWYAMFLLYGTKGNDGKKGGFINKGIPTPSEDFLVKAVRQGGNSLMRDMEDNLNKYLNKKIKKLKL